MRRPSQLALGRLDVVLPPPDVSALSPADAEAVLTRFRREREVRRGEMAAEFFRDEVCRRTAIVVARPISQNVLLTANDDFLFTHYVMLVERWIRPPSDTRTSIDVAVASGSAVVAGQSVSATAAGLTMPVLNERGVFYLAAIKDSAWYATGTPARLDDPREPDLLERLSAAAATCR
jgi:hypothetical protein